MILRPVYVVIIVHNFVFAIKYDDDDIWHFFLKELRVIASRFWPDEAADVADSCGRRGTGHSAGDHGDVERPVGPGGRRPATAKHRVDTGTVWPRPGRAAHQRGSTGLWGGFDERGRQPVWSWRTNGRELVVITPISIYRPRTPSVIIVDDWIGLSSVLRPRQNSIGYGRRFLQVKRPNQQYQSTEGTNSTQTNQTYNKQTWTQKKQQVP